MPTMITLPEHLVAQLQSRATIEQRSVEALAIAYIEAGLTDIPESTDHLELFEPSSELLALVERIKATPPNPAHIVPAKGNLATVLRTLEAAMPDADYDLDAEIAALDAAEAELHAINRADDLREGRG